MPLYSCPVLALPSGHHSRSRCWTEQPFKSCIAVLAFLEGMDPKRNSRFCELLPEDKFPEVYAQINVHM